MITRFLYRTNRKKSIVFDTIISKFNPNYAQEFTIKDNYL